MSPGSTIRSRQAGGMRLCRQRDGNHLIRRRHFEIERLVDLVLEPGHVLVADMPPILAQVSGDPVGAGRDRDLGGAHRVGMAPAARIAQRCDMIDVDAEAEGMNLRHAVV